LFGKRVYNQMERDISPASETFNLLPMTLPDDATGALPPSLDLSLLILHSYRRITRHQIVPAGLDDVQAARWLYEDAPFCVLAHDLSADPCFIYANKAAQRCFEYSWAAFTALPSRLSAEAPDRAERQMLLDRVAHNGFADGYRGLRVSRSGRRFFIEDGTVWQLLDKTGGLHGQGAMFPRWTDAATGRESPA